MQYSGLKVLDYHHHSSRTTTAGNCQRGHSADNNRLIRIALSLSSETAEIAFILCVISNYLDGMMYSVWTAYVFA